MWKNDAFLKGKVLSVEYLLVKNMLPKALKLIVHVKMFPLFYNCFKRILGFSRKFAWSKTPPPLFSFLSPLQCCSENWTYFKRFLWQEVEFLVYLTINYFEYISWFGSFQVLVHLAFLDTSTTESLFQQYNTVALRNKSYVPAKYFFFQQCVLIHADIHFFAEQGVLVLTVMRNWMCASSVETDMPFCI